MASEFMNRVCLPTIMLLKKRAAGHLADSMSTRAKVKHYLFIVWVIRGNHHTLQGENTVLTWF
jgi:hypothetical protein